MRPHLRIEYALRDCVCLSCSKVIKKSKLRIRYKDRWSHLYCRMISLHKKMSDKLAIHRFVKPLDVNYIRDLFFPRIPNNEQIIFFSRDDLKHTAQIINCPLPKVKYLSKIRLKILVENRIKQMVINGYCRNNNIPQDLINVLIRFYDCGWEIKNFQRDLVD